MTGLAAVVADYVTSWPLLVITAGSWRQGGESGGVMMLLVLLPRASLLIQQSATVVAHFFLQLQGERHYVMYFLGGRSLLLGFD